MPQDASIGAKVDKETKKKLRVLAAMNDTTMSDMLRTIVEDKLEEEEDSGNFQSISMAALS